MGFRVVAVGRGSDIAEDDIALGVHRYVYTQAEDAVAALKRLGGLGQSSPPTPMQRLSQVCSAGSRRPAAWCCSVGETIRLHFLFAQW